MNLELIKKINLESPWFIFNISELKQKKIEEFEYWEWFYVATGLARNGSYEVKDVYEDGHPSTHHRKICLAGSRYAWYTDKKVKRRTGTTILSTGNTIPVRNSYTLSNEVRNSIIEAIRPFLRGIETVKIEAIDFLEGNGYDPQRPWLIFKKKWLYEQVASNDPLDDDFFTIGGEISGKFEIKNDAKLREFLQKLGELPVDTPTNNSNSDTQSGTQSSPPFQSYPQNTQSEIRIQPRSIDYNKESSYSQVDSKKAKDEEINLETNSLSPKINSENEQLNNQPSSEKLEKINEPKKPNDFSLVIDRDEESGSKKEVEEASSNSEKINQSLSSSKQEVINQIKNQLAQNPDLKNSIGGKHQNWEQEIKQLTNQKEVLAYQAALLQIIQKKQNLKLTRKEVSFEPKTNHKNNTITLIIAGFFLLSAFLGYLFWKKSPKK